MKYKVQRIKKRTKGRFLWKQEWITFCSRHPEYDGNCSICRNGFWRPSIIMWYEHVLYKISYKLWFHYMNGHWPEDDYRKTLIEDE